MFPLFIAKAIDGAINQSHSGVFMLGVLGLTLLFVGVGRRVFDSRFYGNIYETMGLKLTRRMSSKLPSIKTARLNMMREFVEFLENTMPEIINNIMGLVGVVLILYSLNTKVFTGSLLVTLFIFLVYVLTSKKTMRYNEESNNESEHQVDVMAINDQHELKNHLSQTVKWNVKLSDLEALNFSLSWMAALIFLMITIIVSASQDVVQYGVLFALVMYAFQYVEIVLNLPLFYQNWLRLKEIISRLNETDPTIYEAQ